MLLGEQETHITAPWQALEEIPDLLRGRSWMSIGGTYTTRSRKGTLDEHLKRHVRRATGCRVAGVRQEAGVVTGGANSKEPGCWRALARPWPPSAPMP